MSGIELLFIDGGATVTTLVGAGAAFLGYRQHKEDELELAGPQELERLRAMLREAYDSMDAGHRGLTAAWHGPLSLFRSEDAVAALQRGVPQAAVDVVFRVQELVLEAAALTDLHDVYDAQLAIAQHEGRGLLRGPVLTLRDEMDTLTQELLLSTPGLVLAREAFAPGAAPCEEERPWQVAAESFITADRRCVAPSRVQEAHGSSQLPIAILRDRRALGELWGAVDTVAHSSGESLKRALRRRGVNLGAGEGTPEAKEPQEPEEEFSPYVLAYM